MRKRPGQNRISWRRTRVQFRRRIRKQQKACGSGGWAGQIQRKRIAAGMRRQRRRRAGSRGDRDGADGSSRREMRLQREQRGRTSREECDGGGITTWKRRREIREEAGECARRFPESRVQEIQHIRERWRWSTTTRWGAGTSGRDGRTVRYPCGSSGRGSRGMRGGHWRRRAMRRHRGRRRAGNGATGQVRKGRGDWGWFAWRRGQRPGREGWSCLQTRWPEGGWASGEGGGGESSWRAWRFRGHQSVNEYLMSGHQVRFCPCPGGRTKGDS